MSNAKQETIADIVADIRAQNQGLPEDSYALSQLVCDLLSFADRVDAAHKQETGDLRCLLKVVDDALGESRIAICRICDMKHMCGHGTAKFDPCCIIKDIDSAIAAIRGVGGAK